jgi:hypothetical protein
VSVRPRETEETPAEAGAETAAGPVVSVVPGRPRYHVEGCRFLAGRPDVQSLPVDEARAEGYTACGVCKPDAALAAAEAPAPEPEPAEETAVLDTAAEEAPAETAPARKSTRRAPAKTAAGAATAASTATGRRGATANPEPAETAADAGTDADTGADAGLTDEAGTDSGAAAPAKPARKAAAKATKTTAAAGTSAGSNQVVVIPDRGKFHTETCRFVKDVPGTVTLSKTTAKRQGYTACGVCKP